MKLVFISSTFKDMQFERDKLNTFVVPLINDNISQFGEQTFFGDLRWGVDTSNLTDIESSKKVLDVCLDEIDNCKPYMIVLIGERYGWIPAQELIKEASITKGIEINNDISVTQLEIEYGALLNPDYEGRILFYFRNLDKTSMSEEIKKDYESESDIHREKLNILKQKIIEKYPNYVRYYDAKWDDDKKEVVNLEPLMNMILNDLNKILLSDLSKENNIPWQERTINIANQYLIENAKNYYPITTSDTSELIGPFGENQTSIFFIEGDSGSGKTAFLANAYNILKKKADNNVIFVPFIFELNKYSYDCFNFFKILLYQLEKSLKIKHLEIDENEVFTYDFIKRIKSLINQTNKQIICFIDDCNETLLTLIYQLLYDSFSEDFSTYENIENQFENLYFYITYKANENDIVIPPNYNFSRTFKMDQIQENDKISFIKQLLKKKHKQLDDTVITHITTKKDSNLPFYNKLILDRLLLLDSEDFKNIRQLGDGIDNINKYLINIIDNLSEDTESIIQELVKEASERINKDLVYRLCGILTFLPTSLTENEIIEIFEFNNWHFNKLDFSVTIKTLSSFIEYNKLLSKYKITNKLVISSMKELLNKENYNISKNICDYLKSLNNNNNNKKYALRSASFLNDFDYMANFLIPMYEQDCFLETEINWLIKNYGPINTGLFLSHLVLNYPKIDFSNLIHKLPTTCLLKEEYELYLKTIVSILSNIEIDNRRKNNINYNSFVFLAIYKYIMLFKNNVSFSSAYTLWESYDLFNHFQYEINDQVRLLIHKLCIEMSISICKINNQITYHYEEENPISQLKFDENEQYQDLFLRGQILFESSKRNNDINQYFEVLNLYNKIDLNKDNHIINYLTVDDYKSLIDTYLYNLAYLEDESEILLNNVIYFLQEGYRIYGNRLLKCLPDLYYAIHQYNNLDESNNNLSKVIPYVRKQIAYRTNLINDYVEAIISNCEYLICYAEDLENNYSNYFLEVFYLFVNYYQNLNFLYDESFLKTFYSTCYFLSILHRYNLQEYIDVILDLINNLNEEEVTFNKESYKLFKRFILCFFKQNIDKKEIKQIKELYKKIINSNSIENKTEILINGEAYDFIEYALSDINFKDNYDFEEDYYLEDIDEDEE